MINSTERKLALSGWLYNESGADYASPFKHQKFLFFYEALAKVAGDEYEFSGLKGYKHGPVFSAVWGDRNYEAGAFLQRANEVYCSSPELIDFNRAAIGLFIVQAFTMEELIRITHAMNIWNSKKNEIEGYSESLFKGEHNIPLLESDFNEHDILMVSKMATAFTSEFVNSVKVIPVGSTNYVFGKQDAEKLTPEQYDVLFQLDMEGDLENPVCAYIDEDGAIVVD